MAYFAGLAWESAYRPLTYPEQLTHRWRLSRARLRLARAVRGTAQPHAGDDWSLCLRAPSAVWRVYPHYARIPAAMADAAHAGHVSYSGDHVRPVGASGRARRRG